MRILYLSIIVIFGIFVTFVKPLSLLSFSDLLYLPMSLPCFVIFVIFAIIVIFVMFFCRFVILVILAIACLSGRKWTSLRVCGKEQIS